MGSAQSIFSLSKRFRYPSVNATLASSRSAIQTATPYSSGRNTKGRTIVTYSGWSDVGFCLKTSPPSGTAGAVREVPGQKAEKNISLAALHFTSCKKNEGAVWSKDGCVVRSKPKRSGSAGGGR